MEFKAWMDGFSQACGVQPTAEQWADVKAKVAELANPLGNLSFQPNVRVAPRWTTVSGVAGSGGISVGVVQ